MHHSAHKECSPLGWAVEDVFLLFFFSCFVFLLITKENVSHHKCLCPSLPLSAPRSGQGYTVSCKLPKFMFCRAKRTQTCRSHCCHFIAQRPVSSKTYSVLLPCFWSETSPFIFPEKLSSDSWTQTPISCRSLMTSSTVSSSGLINIKTSCDHCLPNYGSISFFLSVSLSFSLSVSHSALFFCQYLFQLCYFSVSIWCSALRKETVPYICFPFYCFKPYFLNCIAVGAHSFFLYSVSLLRCFCPVTSDALFSFDNT